MTLFSFNSILHRYPTITREPQPWEKAMYELQERDLERRHEVC